MYCIASTGLIILVTAGFAFRFYAFPSGILNCGTSKTSIGAAVINLPVRNSLAEDVMQQQFDTDPTLSCIGTNLLNACSTSTAMIKTDTFGLLQFSTIPTNDACVIRLAATDNYSHQPESISCSLYSLERYYNQGSGAPISMPQNFDHAHPELYAADVIRGLFEFEFAPPVSSSCTAVPRNPDIIL